MAGRKGVILGFIVAFGVASTAGAQDAPLERRAHRGAEMGLDVLSASRTGEVAFYAGAFDGDQMLGLRVGARDETDAVPCSVGAMYEYVLHRASTQRLRLTGGGSYNRVFSCAADDDVAARPSPALQATATINAGIRLMVFGGRRLGGSLKVLGYVERGRGHAPVDDFVSRGMTVGVSFHGR